MNEEEKQSIEILNSQLLKTDGYDRHQKAIDIILKLIDKQQKEIENRLNEIKDLYNFISIREERIDELAEINEKYKDLYISKDTIRHIRDKAECMDYYSLNDVIDDLTKLIGDEKNDE